MLFNYRFYSISYFGMKIDSFFRLPSDSGIDIPREISISSDNVHSIKFSLEVLTYYPDFTTVTDDYEICDNDDEIDWDFLGIDRPDGSEIPASKGNLKRVHWYRNLVDNKTKDDIIKEKEELRDNEINNME